MDWVDLVGRMVWCIGVDLDGRDSALVQTSMGEGGLSVVGRNVCCSG